MVERASGSSGFDSVGVEQHLRGFEETKNGIGG